MTTPQNRDIEVFKISKIAISIFFTTFLKFFQKSDIKNHEISKNLISNPVKSLYFAIELEKQLSIALTELF